jgi:hypothetical protein
MSWEFYDKNGSLKQAVARAVNPMAKIWRSTAQGIISGMTTSLIFDSVLYDTDVMWNPASPTVLTIKTAGRYLVVGNLLLNPNSGGTTRYMSIVLNGNDIANQQGLLTDYPRMSCSAVVNLVPGDQISLSVFQDSGTTLPTYSGNGASTLAVTKVDGVVYPTGKPPRITNSPISGGPPLAPDEGDIWNATGVDANGTRWQFQYNPGSASAYKWEFIGGARRAAGPSGNIATASTAMVDLTGAPTFVIPRTGDYIVDWGMYATNGGTYASASTIFTQIVGSLAGIGNVFQAAQMVAVFSGGRGKFDEVRTLTAGETIKIQVRTNSAGSNMQALEATLGLTPIRIA